MPAGNKNVIGCFLEPLSAFKLADLTRGLTADHPHPQHREIETESNWSSQKILEIFVPWRKKDD